MFSLLLHTLANGLQSSSVIYAYGSEINAIRNYWSGRVIDIELPYYLRIYQTYYRGVSFSLVANEYVPVTLESVKCRGSEIIPDENGLYTITGLVPDSSYDIVITYKTADGEEKSYSQTVETARPGAGAYLRSHTQTTMTLYVSANYDATCAVGRKGVRCAGNDYYCTGDEVVLRGLVPNYQYVVEPFAEYGTQRMYGEMVRCRPASLNPSVTALNISPTSIMVKGSYTAGDAHVSETSFTDHGTGNTLTLTGLTPNTFYTVNYYVRTEEGSYETVRPTYTTNPTLELTTL